MAFTLFLVLNTVLFLRPGDMVPELAGLPIYQVCITLCWLCFLPMFFDSANFQRMFAHPITWCVLGLGIAIVLSNLLHGRTSEARQGGGEFAKVVLYYLLLVGLINSRERFQTFLSTLVCLITIMTLITVLQFHRILDLVSYPVFMEQAVANPETLEIEIIPRLRSLGMFNDPNDFCLILVVGIMICFYRLGSAHGLLGKALYLCPPALFAYSIVLTQSRGGLLGLLACIFTNAYYRWGWRRVLVLAFCFSPVLLAFKGRMTSISTGEDTAQERIQLWSEGLLMLRESPLFGIGEGQFAERVGLVAHNSFVHCFAELGLLGGSLFIGCFYIGTMLLVRIGQRDPTEEDAEFRRFQPYLLGMLIGFAGGLFSLSRPYVVVTYLLLGLVTAYTQPANMDQDAFPLDNRGRLMWQVVGASLAFLVAIHLFVRFSVQYG